MSLAHAPGIGLDLESGGRRICMEVGGWRSSLSRVLLSVCVRRKKGMISSIRNNFLVHLLVKCEAEISALRLSEYLTKNNS